MYCNACHAGASVQLVSVCVSVSFVTCDCRPVAAISNGATNHLVFSGVRVCGGGGRTDWL